MANKVGILLALSGQNEVTAGLSRVVDGLNKAGSSITPLADGFGLLKAAAVAFAGVASVNAFKDMVDGSIRAAAGLHDMSIQTGASVAALMAFRSVAATTNTSVEGIATAMNRAAKGMAVANEDSKGIGQAIKALGLDFGALQKMKPEDQMLAVAKAMDGFGDGAGKSAAAMALYGKEGAKMLPFLKDLADGSEEVTKKLTKQQEEAKKAQAAMADDYVDNLTKIKKASEAWKKDVSMAVLPAVWELSQAFLDVDKSTHGIKQGLSDLSADGSITNWARKAVFGVTYVMDAFQGLSAVASTVMIGIGAKTALAAENVSMIWKVTTGLLGKEPVINIINASMKRQKDIAKEVADELDKTWGNETFGSRLRARITDLQATGAAAVAAAAAAKAAKPQVDWKNPKDKKDSAAEKLSDYQKLTRVIAEKQAQDDEQLRTGHDLSESEKIRAKMIADLATGTITLSDIEKKRVNTGLDQLSITERLIAADNYYDEQQKARYAASSALVKSAVEEADKNEALARTFGMSAAAIAALEIARLEEQLAQKTSINQCTEETTKLEALIAAKKRSAAALGSVEAQQAGADAAKKVAAEWQKTADKINDSITDALMRGFESGKGFAENMRDTVVNMFKTMVLRPVISAIVSPVSQGIAGAMGLSGAANAAGAANAITGVGTLAAGISAFGGTLATGFMNTLVGSGMTGGLTAAGAMIANGAWASGLGMAAGALGPLALGIAALSMIGNKDKATANTGNASAQYDAAGNRTDYQTYYGGSSAGVDKMLASLQDSYTKSAQALGIAAAATQFNYGGNTGKNGESANFALGGGAGNTKFYQGETASSEAAISLAASRAVFAALQGSDLPAYLAKVFNSVTADAMTQEQITGTLAYAASLKQVRDALLETREPMAVLQSNVDQAFMAMGTTAESFKTDFVAALDGGISPEKLAQWQGLQVAMTDLAALAEKDAASKAAAAKTIRENVEKEIGIATSWAQKLAVLQGTATERKLSLEADLLTTNNEATKALIGKVYALEDEKTATEAMADAATKAADAVKTAADNYKSATDALASANDALKSSYAGVSSAYKAIQDAAANAANAVTGAQDGITNGYLSAQAAVASAQDNLANVAVQASKAMAGFADSIQAFLTEMATTGLGANSKTAQLAALQADFAITSAQAKAGDQGALGSLTGKAGALLKAGKEQAATALDFARLSSSVANALTDISGAIAPSAAAADANPATKAQADLAKAQADLAKWSAAVAVSGASTAKATTDYLDDWRKATAASAVAQANLLRAQDATKGIQMGIEDGIGSLLDAITALNQNISAQAAAVATMLSLMTIKGAGGTDAGAGSYTGTQVADGIKSMQGSSAAQIVSKASTGFGVTSGDLAKVADVIGNTGISAYQKAANDVTALDQMTKESITAQANAIAAAQGISPERALYNYATTTGINAAMVDKYMGWPNGTSNGWAAANGLPAFEQGINVVPYDMTARLHKDESVVPARFNPYNPNAASNTNSETAAALRALADRLDKIEANTRATAGHTAGTDRKLARVIPGNAVLTQVAV